MQVLFTLPVRFKLKAFQYRNPSVLIEAFTLKHLQERVGENSTCKVGMCTWNVLEAKVVLVNV